jgi:hypothetical protein
MTNETIFRILFIYIAIADLIPSLHVHSNMQRIISQVAFTAVGNGTIMLFRTGR